MQNEGASGFNGNTQGYGVQMANGYKVGVSESGAAYMGGFSAGDISWTQCRKPFSILIKSSA